MKNYADDHLLKTYENSLVYVERTLQNGKIRRGIVGAIDLEQYSYTPEHEAKIRSTEKNSHGANPTKNEDSLSGTD